MELRDYLNVIRARRWTIIQAVVIVTITDILVFTATTQQESPGKCHQGQDSHQSYLPAVSRACFAFSGHELFTFVFVAFAGHMPTHQIIHRDTQQGTQIIQRQGAIIFGPQ